MAHAFHQLYYHFVWSTHARNPHIHRSWRPKLLTIINEEATNHGGWPIRHNAMPDHAHLLVRLPPTIAVADFIGELKGSVAFRVAREIKPKFRLRWQEGYGVLTLRKDEVPRVVRYIDNQEKHRRTGRLSDLLERIEADDVDR